VILWCDMTKHTSFLSFAKTDGRPSVAAFYFAETLDEIRAWQEPPEEGDVRAETKSAKAPESEGETVATFTTEALALIRRFKETLSGYHALINLNAVMPSMIQAITVEQRVLGFAKGELELVSECEKYATYGVTDENMLAVYRLISEYRELEAGYAVIPGSVMLSLVASFDSLVSDFMRLLLRMRPERFARSDKTVPVRDVLAMASFDELVERLIEDEIDQIMRGTIRIRSNSSKATSRSRSGNVTSVGVTSSKFSSGEISWRMATAS
jgi:hypothetical protein